MTTRSASPRTLPAVLLTAAFLLPSLFLGAASTVAATSSSEPGDTVRAIVHYASFSTIPADETFASSGLTPLYRFKAIPAVAASGEESAFAAARADANVVNVEFDHPINLHMESAIFSTKAVDVYGEAWWPAAATSPREPLAPLTVNGTVIDGRGVTIGVVDSGIHALHPDLWYNPAYVDGMPWEPKVKACVNVPSLLGAATTPYCDQMLGHGTHVAGIAAGNGYAARAGLSPFSSSTNPPLGAAPGASLVGAGLGVLLPLPPGSISGGMLETATGLDYMYDHAEEFGIRVVTNSWGDSPGCTDAFPSTGDSIISITNQLVNDKGVVVLYSASNYAGSTPTWTSTYARNPTPGVITVANYDDRNTGTRAGFINSGSSDGCVASGGAGDYLWTWPDVAAPGTSILSTGSPTAVYVATTYEPPFYTLATGTSMSTPHVAGIAALMMQANPDLTPAQVEKLLIETATPWTDTVTARSVSGPTWNADPSICKVTPTDAAKAELGDTTVNAKFPRFTELAEKTDANLFVCRDFKRGAGLVDARAAVQRALDLRNDNQGSPEVTITSPAAGSSVDAGPVEIRGNVDRLAGGLNAAPSASLAADKTGGPAPLSVSFTLGGTDEDGSIASWNLDFGDASVPAAGTSVPAAVPHSYAANGEYTALLTVTDDRGATASAQVTVRVGSIPQPDGAIAGELMFFDQGLLGIREFIAAEANVVTGGGNVPTFVAGESVSLELRFSYPVAAVPYTCDTPVSHVIFDKDTQTPVATLSTSCTVEAAADCPPSTPCYARWTLWTIPSDLNGRYVAVSVAETSGTHVVATHEFEVVAAPGPTGGSDAHHTIGDVDNDASGLLGEIAWADVASLADELTIVAKVSGLPALDAASGFRFTATMDGEAVSALVRGTGPVLVDASGAILPGEVRWNAEDGLLRLTLDRPCACAVSLATTLAGSVVDRAPDAGAVSVEPVPLGSETDPEATDPEGDAAGGNLGHMDVTKVWVSAETATTFDVTLKLRDLSTAVAGPDSGSVLDPNSFRAGGGASYDVRFCLDNNVNPSTDPNAPRFCYLGSATYGTPAPVFTGSIIARDNGGACTVPGIIQTGSFNLAADTVTFRFLKAGVDATRNAASGAACATEGVERGGNPVSDGHKLTSLQGRTGYVVGVGIGTYTNYGIGDAYSGAESRPYEFGGTPDPLSVDAAGPYAGVVGAPVAVAGVITGGRAPYTCTWSAPGVAFANANACATTVTASAPGAVTLTLSVSDADGSLGLDTATLNVGTTAAERVEVYVAGVLRGTAPVSTSPASPAAPFSVTADLGALAGPVTAEARWIDADGTVLDTATVEFTVVSTAEEPYVTITSPANDPSGASPLSGTVTLSGEAGHLAPAGTGGAPLGAGAPRLVPGARATATLTGVILAPCAACQGSPVGGADLGSSVTWLTGAPGSDTDGVDGKWFAIGGYTGAAYALTSTFGGILDVYFFNDYLDGQGANKGSNTGVAATKTGTVPAGANYAFVYLRRPTAAGVQDGAIPPEEVTLTLTPQVVPPTAPQLFTTTAGVEQITLSWQAPANAGGEAVSGYRLSRDGGAPIALPASPTSRIETGLVAGQTYAYTLTAVNSAGESPAVTASAVPLPMEDGEEEFAITSPANGATGLPGSLAVTGTYVPQAEGNGTTGSGPFSNTYYFFLMNLNNDKCSFDLGHGDIMIASRMIDHAREALGVPDRNIFFFNEDGGMLCPQDDPTNYPKLPEAFRQPNNPFDGPANLAPFAAALATAAEEAAAKEATTGIPARILIMHSSHGLQWPAPLNSRIFGSMMALHDEEVTDAQFGAAISEALGNAESGTGVSIETAILVDCSFCGGFIDSPLPVPGTQTTAVDTAGVVGANRVVEVGCTWVTECFGNPAVTYHHMFERCTFTGAADGYGPTVSTGQAYPAPGGSGDLGDEVAIPDAGHHAKDGLVTFEEAYWCSLASVTENPGYVVAGPVDTIGIQQMFQLSDQMGGDLFGMDGFVLWDVDTDQDLPSKDPSAPLAAGLPSLRAAGTDPEGDARTPFSDLVALSATATDSTVIVDLDVADLTLSSQQLEDVVEYRLHSGDDAWGVCYSGGAVLLFGYHLGEGPLGGAESEGTASYDFATGRIHFELPRSEFTATTLPFALHATSHLGECSTSMPTEDDRIPNTGTVATSNEDDEEVNPGEDEVEVTLDGPGSFLVTAAATLDETAGTWTFDPVGDLAPGTYTATAVHRFDDGSGPIPVAGPLSVTFTVGSDADTTPPTAVTGLTVTGTTATTATLAWNAATDDVGVTAYRLYRSATPGVTPATDTLVATVAETTYTEGGLMPDSTYYYVALAEDAAGNRGPLSNEATATTATEPVGEENVTLRLDGEVFAVLPVDTATVNPTPWSTSLDTLTLADGLHTLEATFADANGDTAVAVVTFAVANLATIAIDAPTPGATVGRSFTFRGTTEGTGGPSGVQATALVNGDGSVNLDVAARHVEGVAAARALVEAFAGEPGFIGAAPLPDGSPVIQVVFQGAAPADTRQNLVPDGWTLDVVENVLFERAVKRVQATDIIEMKAPVREGPPVPAMTDGIGPGAPVYTYYKDGVVGICTANFVWQDQNGNYYLGAAGHCFLPETATATHGPGADYNVNNPTNGIEKVDVCVSSCVFGGGSALVGAAFNVGVLKGTSRTLGQVAYSRQASGGVDVGNDFGIVRIPESLYNLVRPHMPVWNGPTGEETMNLGEYTVHYGNAAGFGETFPTHARVGVGMATTGSAWFANIPSFQGDSGSAINRGLIRGSTKVMEGENAFGLLTHLVINTGVVAGTTMTRAKAMAAEAGLVIRPVLQGETIAPPNTVPAAPTALAASPGDQRVTLTWTAPANGGSPITVYTVKYGTASGVHTLTQAATSTSATVTGLTNGQPYFFVVTATNANGEGPASTEATATPRLAATVPGAPAGLVVIPGDGRVTLLWDRPASDGGSRITQYNVKYGNAPGAHGSTVSVTDTSALLTGLTNGVPVYAVVTAVNALGESAASNEASATPDAGSAAPFAVEVRGVRTSDGAPLFGWEPVDAYDGSTWAHAVSAPLGTYGLTLQARLLKADVLQDEASVAVTLNDPNRAPVANAGADRSVNEAAAATLTASGTDADGHGLSFSWQQVSGPAVPLEGTGASVSFMAPHVDAPTTLTFRVTAMDPLGASGADEVVVTVQSVDAITVQTVDGVPLATATENPLFGTVTVAGGSTFEPSSTDASLAPVPVITGVRQEGARLLASAADSADPDGRIVSYAWSFGDGATATGPAADHVYRAAGIHLLTLTVTDNRGVVAATSMPILVAGAGLPLAGEAPAVETYYLHRSACNNDATDPMWMDHTPAPTFEAGDGCGSFDGVLDLSWTATEPATGTYRPGDLVQVTLRGITVPPQPAVTLRTALYSDGLEVARGEATADALSLLGLPACAEWVVPMALTANVPAGATLRLHAAATTIGSNVAVCYEGGTESSRVALTSSAAPPAAKATVTAPAHGTVYDPSVAGTVVSITGTTQGADAVQVSIGDASFTRNLLPATGVASWTASWSLDGVPDGAYTLYARGVKDGVAGSPASVGIVVKSTSGAPAPHAPSVQVQAVPAGAPVSPSGWRGVDAHDATSGDWSYDWATADLPRGAYEFHARLVDNGVVEVARTAFPALLGTNHAPVVTPPGNLTVDEGAAITVVPTASDLDGDDLTWSIAGLPAGATFDAETGTLSWTPSFHQAGAYEMTLTASDGELPGSARFTLTVVDVTNPPVFDALGEQSGRERAEIRFTVHAVDPEGMSVTYRLGPGAPDGATLNEATGEFAWTPTYEQGGLHGVLIEAVDGDGSVGNTTVPVRIEDVPTALYNGVTGKGYDTIAEALAAAAPGDTLLVRPGTYTENVVIAVPGVTLCATGPLGIACASGTGARLAPPAGVPVRLTAAGAQVKGFDIVAVAPAAAAIVAEGSPSAPLSFVRVRDNLIDHASEASKGVTGILLRHTVDAIVEGNAYTGATAQGSKGIHVEDSARAAILTNTVENAGTGLLLHRATAARVEDNAFLAPAATTGGGETMAVSLVLGGGHALRGNTYTGAAIGLFVMGAPDVASRNDTWTGTGTGIRLRASSGVQPQSFLVNGGRLPDGASKLVLEADTRNVNVDARYNHWGAFTRTSIRAASIRDQGVGNVVNVDCFIDENGADAVCPPEVAFGMSAARAHPGAPLSFTDETTSGGRSLLTWSWSFGDGATSLDRHPTHTWESLGAYPVTLTVRDAEGYESTRTEVVEVANLAPIFEPVADVTVPEGGSVSFPVVAADPEGEAVTLTSEGRPSGAKLTATGGSGTFTWKPGATAGGSYLVTFVATDDLGGRAERTVRITVTDVELPPVASFALPAAVTLGAGIRVSDVSSDPDGGGIVARVWTFGDGATSTAAIVSHRYADPGQYTMTLTVTDDEGAKASVARTVIVDGAAPSVAATLQGTLRGNVAKDYAVVKVSAADEASGIRYVYHRLDGGPTDSHGGGFSLSVTTPGPHTVEVWAVDRAGNVAPVERLEFVVDAAAPEVTLVSPEELAVELGSEVTLEAFVEDKDAGVRRVAFLVDGEVVGLFEAGGLLSVTVPLPAGLHRFTVEAEDHFGHATAVEETFVSLGLPDL